MESERTLITLTMEYEPEGFLETAGDVLGIPSGQIEEDLKRFRDFIEQTRKERGGWRGRIGEGLKATAGAIRQQWALAQSVEAVNERTDQEIAPDEAGIETDRILGEDSSAFPDEHKPLVGGRWSNHWKHHPTKAKLREELGSKKRKLNLS